MCFFTSVLLSTHGVGSNWQVQHWCVPVSRCQPANKLSIEYFQLGHSTSSQEKTIKRGWRGIHNIAAHVVSGILDEDQWRKTKMIVPLKCTLCAYFNGSLALLAEEVSPGDCHILLMLPTMQRNTKLSNQ